MSNIFSFERFLKVLKYDLIIRVPAIGIFFLVLLIMPHVLHQMMGFGNVFPVDLYGVMCVFVVFFAPFKIYTVFRGKQELGSYLMLPASSLEKFVSMVLVSLVLVPVSFVLSCYLLDAILCLLFSGQYGSVVTVDYMLLLRGADALFALTGAAILGNTLFKKGAPGKTLLCMLILVLLWTSVIASKFFDMLLGEGVVAVDPEVLTLWGDITAIAYFAGATLFYILAWWRIRKIQIS